MPETNSVIWRCQEEMFVTEWTSFDFLVTTVFGEWMTANGVKYSADQARDVDVDDTGVPSAIDIRIRFDNPTDAVHFKLRFSDEFRLLSEEDSEKWTASELNSEFDARVDELVDAPRDFISSLYADGNVFFNYRNQTIIFHRVNGQIKERNVAPLQRDPGDKTVMDCYIMNAEDYDNWPE